MRSLLLLLLLATPIAAQDWETCPDDAPKLMGFKPVLASTEQTFTYRVDFIKDPKIKGKVVPRQEILDAIDKELAVAYGDKLAIRFVRVTGSARFVFRIENHRDRYRGTHFSDQHIMLHSEAPWSSARNIAQIAIHEIGHSSAFFGYGHNNGSFVENGVRYSHLMNPDDPRKAPKYATYPTWTSPQETARLVARYGKQPTTPGPIKPTPGPIKPTPGPIKPTPGPAPTTKVEAESATTHKGIIPVRGDASGNMLMGWINKGESMTFTVNTAQAGTYTVTHYVASIHNGAQLSANGVKVNVPNTRGWDKWQAVQSKLALKKGQQTLTVRSESDAGWNYDYFTLSLDKPVDPKAEAMKRLRDELTKLRAERAKHLATIEQASKSLESVNKTIEAKNKELDKLKG